MNCPSQTSALPQNSLTAPTSQLSHLQTTRHHLLNVFSSAHLRPNGDGGGGQVLGQPPQLLPLHLGGLVHPAGHPLQHPARQRSAAVAHFHRESDSTGSTEGYLIVTHYQLIKLYCNSFSLLPTPHFSLSSITHWCNLITPIECHKTFSLRTIASTFPPPALLNPRTDQIHLPREAPAD